MKHIRYQKKFRRTTFSKCFQILLNGRISEATHVIRFLQKNFYIYQQETLQFARVPKILIKFVNGQHRSYSIKMAAF